MPALRRGTVLVQPDEPGPFASLSAAAACGATFFPTTPAWIHSLLRLASPPPWPDSVRLTISAGAPLAAATATRFRNAFGRTVHTFYGSSECGGICYDRDGGAAERGTVGPPVERVQVDLELLAGESAEGLGRVVVRGASVAAGYAPAPEPSLAAGRFVAGDLASWRDGELALRGRIDDLINVRGNKVSPREVEQVILGIQGVEEVAVFGIEDPGGGGQMIRAVVAGDVERLSPRLIADLCRELLVSHKVPRSIVVTPRLPRNPRGKIDRDALLTLGAPRQGVDPA
jgi:long-chain acyl-CoA synthetase